jgi:hypothetical protein
MPCDRNGRELGVGDLVLVPCEVLFLHIDSGANLTVRVAEPVPLGGGRVYRPVVHLNSGQVEKVERPGTLELIEGEEVAARDEVFSRLRVRGEESPGG